MNYIIGFKQTKQINLKNSVFQLVTQLKFCAQKKKNFKTKSTSTFSQKITKERLCGR